MRFLVDVLQFLAALAVAPVILYRAWTTGKYRADWDQRRGFLPELPPASRPRVWVHAVSVGEVNAVRGLVDAWRKQSPEMEFVISTTTDTGQARARQLFPDLIVIRYPLDFSWFVTPSPGPHQADPDRAGRAGGVVPVRRPLAGARGIPIAVVNGRLSERSVRRFGLGPVGRPADVRVARPGSAPRMTTTPSGSGGWACPPTG